jgi:hypothetical protein
MRGIMPLKEGRATLFAVCSAFFMGRETARADGTFIFIEKERTNKT